MAITVRSAHGNSVSKAASATTFAHTVTTANVLVGDTALFAVVSDNISTADGNTNDHSSVADSKGNTWTKVYEFTNAPTAAAAVGVTASLWKSEITVQMVSTTDTITITFASALTAKGMGLISFAKSTGAGATLSNDGVIGAEATASTSGPSTTLSGLPNVSHLFFNVDGFETTQTGFTLVQDTDYTNQFNNGTTGAAADTNMKIMGATRIATLTGDTHLSTQALTCDSVGILASFVEVAPSTSGPLDEMGLSGFFGLST